MTPTLITADWPNRLFVAALVDGAAIHVSSPMLGERLNDDDTFTFGVTDNLKHVGERKLGLSCQTRIALLMRQVGDRCVWLCSSEIGIGPSTGAVLVSATVRSSAGPEDPPPIPDTSWKILAMHNGVVFTPDLT